MTTMNHPERAKLAQVSEEVAHIRRRVADYVRYSGGRPVTAGRLREVMWTAWGALPAYRAGRLDIGPLVIQSRSRLCDDTWESMRVGAARERTDPGWGASLEAKAEAKVRHLRVV